MGSRSGGLGGGMLVREALRLLLEILEAAEPVIAARLIQDLHPLAGTALIKRGILVSHGHELTLADVADVPVTALPSDQIGGFGYFSGEEGWDEIDPDSMVHFRVDIGALARNLLPEDAVLIRNKSQVLIDNLLWD